MDWIVSLNVTMYMYAEKIGLVVISLERYFKIVHALVHRKYYRKWMTVVGVILPWTMGFCTFFIPVVLSTRAVPGQCPMMASWPSEGVRTVRTDVYSIMQ